MTEAHIPSRGSTGLLPQKTLKIYTIRCTVGHYLVIKGEMKIEKQKKILKVLQLIIDMSISKLGSYDLTPGRKI